MNRRGEVREVRVVEVVRIVTRVDGADRVEWWSLDGERLFGRDEEKKEETHGTD